jgi:uncharacterized membrane protein YadS
MRKFFRFGPVLLLAPVLLWAAVWNSALSEENQSWYIMWPMFGFIGVAAIWHVALFVVEKERVAYFIYAVIHMPIFCGIWFGALILATRFPL